LAHLSALFQHPASAPAWIDIRFLGDTIRDQDKAWVDDLVVTAVHEDLLPDDTVTYTQGYYGQSPQGEQVTCDILTDAEMDADDLQEIRDILWELYGEDTGDISTDELLCLFLVGEVGAGPDDGYLPAGKLDPYPNNNLAAQKITLLLNLNLNVVLESPEIPIELEYFLNIDPVLDLIDGFPDVTYYPVETTFGELGACDGGGEPDLCPAGTATLTSLGYKVVTLDAAGTTVEHMLTAACEMLKDELALVDVNGVTLDVDEMAALLSLINESYDAGVPTAFVIFPNN